MPGLYKEMPSRHDPEPDPRCAGDYDTIGGDILATGGLGKKGAPVANYKYQRKCPNAQNLIAIIGDSDDPDRKCDVKCSIQIHMGRRRGDVVISGQRTKLNVIRADRADGIHLQQLHRRVLGLQQHLHPRDQRVRDSIDIKSRYSREYGFLSFTSDHGLYNRLEAFGSGDSGIYPGSGPEGHCRRYGIEIRDSTPTTTRSATPARPATACGPTTTASTTTAPA